MLPKPILTLGLALLAPCLHAQESTPPAQLADQPLTTLYVTAQLVTLDASVEDRRTHTLIPSLTPADFLLLEDGVPQPVTHLSEDRLPLSISFLFDLSDTVQPVLKHLAEGAATFLSQLRPEDEAAVLTFSNHVEVLQPFTQDHTLLEAAIQTASTQHARNIPTFIHESVFTATEFTSHATIPESRRVEIWLTDGTSNYTGLAIQHMVSKREQPETIHSKQQAVDLVNATGIATAVLLERSFMTDMIIPFLPLAGHLYEINAYADLSGAPISHTSGDEVAQTLALLIDTLRHRYTLAFRPVTAKPAGTLCHLTLALSPAFYAAHPTLPAKAVVVRTRKLYIR